MFSAFRKHRTKMDNLDDSETAKISDSAYSNSCSNSQSRRSHSSKSTHSGSNSSGSSGYGGQPSGYGNNQRQPPEKVVKKKESKKKIKSKNNLKAKVVQIPPKCDPPAPVADSAEPKLEKIDVALMAPASGPLIEKCSEIMDSSCIDTADSKDETESENVQLMKLNPNSDEPPDIPHCEDSFSCVISMHDGVVTYTTPTVTAMLGYPKEMWIGRSFLDFVHQKDRNIFASQISSGLAVPKNVNGMQIEAAPQLNATSSMVCRLRRYRGLSRGFGVKEQSVSFTPFQLKFSFKKINQGDGGCMYLVIQATPYFTAFKVPHEVLPKPVPFIIRHSAKGIMQYVDPDSVPYLGFLPQDLVDKCALEMYHPHDLDYLQHVYETIVKEGSMPRGTPYRMMIHNGDFIKLETEWTSFINPWSRKLEFVIGKHHVVEGPKNPDVFQEPDLKTMFRLNEDDRAKTRGMTDNIVRIMTEVLTKPAEAAKKQITKRRQDLADFMETLMEETTKNDEGHGLNSQRNENYYYEHDSVILGGISPHHDYNDSKSSTDTPISYNQLNYNDNLQRYFDYHEPYDIEEIETMGAEDLYDRHRRTGKRLSPFSRHSPDYEERLNTTKSNAMVIKNSVMLLREVYTPLRLTESLLNRHNAEMEKELMKQHRETRPATRSERERAVIENRQKKKEHLARCNASFQPTAAGVVITTPHGTKRASKPSESETPPGPKQQCTSQRQTRPSQASGSSPHPNTAAPTTSAAGRWPSTPRSSSHNPFLVGMGVPRPMPLVTPVSTVPGYVPIYYARPAIPLTMAGYPSTSQGMPTLVPQQPSMQCMMYRPTMYGAPIMYGPMGHMAYVMRQDVVAQQTQASSYPLRLPTRNYEEACNPTYTNLSADTRSSNGSVWRKRKEELQRKYDENNRVYSRETSPVMYNRISAAIQAGAAARAKSSKGRLGSHGNKTDADSSSYSSFYSSFFKTDSGSADDSDTKKTSSRKVARYRARMARREGRMYEKEETYRAKREMKYGPKRKMEPPWMDEVVVTSELIYNYQITTKSVDEVLSSDKQRMKSMEQPPLVNEQLSQLYQDMHLEGGTPKLSLEEGITSSSSSGEESWLKSARNRRSRSQKKREYSKLVMIYEEDAPFPPPDENALMAPMFD